MGEMLEVVTVWAVRSAGGPKCPNGVAPTTLDQADASGFRNFCRATPETTRRSAGGHGSARTEHDGVAAFALLHDRLAGACSNGATNGSRSPRRCTCVACRRSAVIAPPCGSTSRALRAAPGASNRSARGRPHGCCSSRARSRTSRSRSACPTTAQAPSSSASTGCPRRSSTAASTGWRASCLPACAAAPGRSRADRRGRPRPDRRDRTRSIDGQPTACRHPPRRGVVVELQRSPRYSAPRDCTYPTPSVTYRTVCTMHRGREALAVPVTTGSSVAERAHGLLDTATERGCCAKYDRYGPKIVGSVVGPDVKGVTVRLLPHTPHDSKLEEQQ